MAEQDTGTKPDSTSVSVEEYNRTLEKTRRLEAELTDKNKTLGRYSALGDPDDIKGKLEDYTLIRKQNTGGDQKKIDELITAATSDLDKTYRQKLTEIEADRNDKAAKLKRLQVVNPAIQAAADVLHSDAIPLFTSVFEQSLDTDSDGKIIVKDSEGKPRRSPTDPRVNMTLGEFVKELADKHPSVAKATGKPGVKPGGDKAHEAAGGLTAQEYLAMTAAERAELPRATQQALAAQVYKLDRGRVSQVKQ